jgi:hypothetical protein
MTLSDNRLGDDPKTPEDPIEESERARDGSERTGIGTARENGVEWWN